MNIKTEATTDDEMTKTTIVETSKSGVINNGDVSVNWNTSNNSDVRVESSNKSTGAESENSTDITIENNSSDSSSTSSRSASRFQLKANTGNNRVTENSENQNTSNGSVKIDLNVTNR